MTKPEMSKAAKKQLDLLNAEQVDWVGRCMVCGETVTGTMADLKAHARECGARA